MTDDGASTRSPTGAAKSGSFDEFMAVYDQASSDATALLPHALGNADPAARVAIATRLLDDGADASVQHGGNSAINVLLGQRRHDVEAEAVLLARLLDEGADVNQPSRRGDAPIMQLVLAPSMGDADMVPFYRVLLARPELDLDARAFPKGKDTSTIRERIFGSGGFVRKQLRELVLELDREG